ncbi:uncharacterized protein EV420DRAFT_1619997 [Desarmillaria tabescens]|uniref:Uncharacterized protein n=1 Tax=Armillaria tabescens TaxID=1929756 RepID=A0AA39KF78_ARMTA|nr:uncharacterized protein EV420DRAFT_1619997 [Desarmillaria tabescens]KAK0460071.1 hypothetical protein EV420DRAFT_1619997 [Desarmillaria tabescens]
MCQRMADGTRWLKCMHFQRHMITAIVDCNSRRCTRSLRHPRECRQPTCLQVRNFGEEIQRDIDKVDEYCFACRAAQARAARDAAAASSS